MSSARRITRLPSSFHFSFGSERQARPRLESLFFSSSPAEDDNWRTSALANPIEYIRTVQHHKKAIRKQSQTEERLSQISRAYNSPETDLYQDKRSKNGDPRRRTQQVTPFAADPSEHVLTSSTFENVSHTSTWAHSIMEALPHPFLAICCILSIAVSILILCFPLSFTSTLHHHRLLKFSICLDTVFCIRLYLQVFHRKRGTEEGTLGKFTRYPQCPVRRFHSKELLFDIFIALPLTSSGLGVYHYGLAKAGSFTRLIAVVPFLRNEDAIYKFIDRVFSTHRGNLRRIVRLMLRLLLLCFMLGGLFYWVSFTSMTDGNNSVPTPIRKNETTSTQPFQFSDDGLAADILTSFYFILQTLLTVGFGDILPGNMGQLKFVIVCFIFAVGVHSLLIAHMSALLKNLDVTSAHYKHKVDSILKYLRVRQIQPEVRNKVTDYFNFLWERQKGRLENKILGPLPPSLREKINRGRRSALLQIPFFQRRDMTFVDAVVTSLEPQILNFGEFLCIRNQPVDALFILGDGKLEVLSAGRGDGCTIRGIGRQNSGFFAWNKSSQAYLSQNSKSESQLHCKVIESISPGPMGFVGDEILFSSTFKHKYSVRATRMCEIQRLDIEVYHFVLSLYNAYTPPESQVSAISMQASISDRNDDEEDPPDILFTKPVVLPEDNPNIGGFQLQRKRLGKQRRYSSLASAEVIQDVIATQTSAKGILNNVNAQHAPLLDRTPDIPSASGGVRRKLSSSSRYATSKISSKISSLARSTTVTMSKFTSRWDPAGRRRRSSASSSGSSKGDEESSNIYWPNIPEYFEVTSHKQLSSIDTLVRDEGILRTVQSWQGRGEARDKKSKASKVGRKFTFRSLSINTQRFGICAPILVWGEVLITNLWELIVDISRRCWTRIAWSASVVFAHLVLCMLPSFDLAAVSIKASKEALLPWQGYLFADILVFANVTLLPKFEPASNVKVHKRNSRSTGAKVSPKGMMRAQSTVTENGYLTSPFYTVRKVAEVIRNRGHQEGTIYGVLFLVDCVAYACFASGLIKTWVYLRIFSCGVLFWPLLNHEIQRLGYHFEKFQRMTTLQHVAIKVATIVLVSGHWYACLWIWSLAKESVDSSEEVLSMVMSNYWKSMYWACVTMTTVGYGDVVPTNDAGRILAVVVMLLGVTTYAGFISLVAAITQSGGAATNQFEQFEECCRHYLTQRDIPRELISLCHQFIEHASQHQQRLDETEMLAKDFPTSLEDCVRDEILGNRFLHTSSIFVDTPRPFIRDLQRYMRKEIFLPGQVITCGYDPVTGKKRGRPDERGITDGMIFLEEGEAAITSYAEDGTKKKMGNINTGRTFAANALFKPEDQHLELCATKICEIWVLTSKDLHNCVRNYDGGHAEDSVLAAEEQLKLETLIMSTVRERAQATTSSAEAVAKNLANAKLNKFMVSSRKFTSHVHDWGIVLPDSKIYKGWNLLMAACVVGNIVSASYRVGLGRGSVGESQSKGMTAIDVLIDFVFLLNVVLRDRCFACEVDGVMLSRRPQVSANYRARNARFDLFSSIPLSFIIRAVLGWQSLGLQEYAALRFLCIIQVYRMPEWASICMNITPTKYQDVMTLSLLLGLILLCAHISGCFFFGIGRWNMTSGTGSSWAVNSSDHALLIFNNATGIYDATKDAYIRSVYWAMTTLTTVGYGDYAAAADSEISYSLIMLMSGGCLYALILNNLEEIIAHSDICSILFQRKVDSMGVYMKKRSLPSATIHRVTSYYHALWVRQKGVEEAWIQDRLPLPVRRALRAHALGLNRLAKFPLFNDWDKVEDLVDMLRPCMALEDTLLFMEGQLIYKCYFVSDGKVEYVSGDGRQVFTSFTSGDSFGEIQFFYNEQTECIARVCERSDFLVLHRMDMDHYLRERPDLAGRYENDLTQLEGDLRKRCSLAAFSKNLERSKVNKLFAMEVVKKEGEFWKGSKLLAPNNVYRRLWDILILGVVYYNLVFIIYRACLLRDAIAGSAGVENAFKEYMPLDIFGDLLILIDGVLHATAFAVVTQTSFLWRRSQVQAHFLRYELWFYALALLPLDYLLQADSIGSAFVHKLGVNSVLPYFIGIARLPRLLLILRLLPLEVSAQSFLDECGVVLTSGYKQILRLGVRALLMAHWMACINTVLSTRYLELLDSGYTIFEAYMVSLYWSMYTITTIGYGNVMVDAPTFAIGCLIMGTFMCDAGVTATVSNILSNQESKLGDAKRRRVALTQYMKSHRIDSDTKFDVLDYIDYYSSTLDGLDESILLNEANLPSHLRLEIVSHITLRCVPHLATHPMFTGFQLGLLQTLALMLSPVVLARGHDLIKKSNKSTPGSMYVSGKFSSGTQTNPSLRKSTSTHHHHFQMFGNAGNEDGSSMQYYPRRMNEIAAQVSLEYLREANITDPSHSLYQASSANVGWQRYPANADDDNLNFLVKGTVQVFSGSASKLVRRGLICRGSGIESAICATHCEMFVLEVDQFHVLTQYSSQIGDGAYKTFLELLRDPTGFQAVQEYLKRHKNGAYMTDLEFWRACERFEKAPNHHEAEEIVEKFMKKKQQPEVLDESSSMKALKKNRKTLVADVAIQFELDFGMMGDEIQFRVGRETNLPGDIFMQAKNDIFRRLELVVKPRFFASAEFTILMLEKMSNSAGSSQVPQRARSKLSTVESLASSGLSSPRSAKSVPDDLFDRESSDWGDLKSARLDDSFGPHNRGSFMNTDDVINSVESETLRSINHSQDLEQTVESQVKAPNMLSSLATRQPSRRAVSIIETMSLRPAEKHEELRGVIRMPSLSKSFFLLEDDDKSIEDHSPIEDTVASSGLANLEQRNCPAKKENEGEEDDEFEEIETIKLTPPEVGEVEEDTGKQHNRQTSFLPK